MLARFDLDAASTGNDGVHRLLGTSGARQS